jgi:DNA-binding winged helix-turn-helix (wHTH) protein/tetratricopeptide (TPR) repeat protein
MPAGLYFDDWAFRPQAPELLRNGARVRLQEQPLQVLAELLVRPGELVTREHLIARLWPKRIVEFDAALNAAVRRLRSALGDEAETPRYIETVPRKGYRFIGTLRPVAIGEPAQVSDRVFTAPTVLDAVELPQTTLTNPSPSLRRVGGRYRPAVLLAASMTIIVLGVIGIRQWRESDAPDAGASTVINEQLRRASFFAHRRAPGDLVRAKQQFEEVLSLDPSSARAWAGIASVHWLEFALEEQPGEISLPKVRDAAQKALDLDPRLAEAHLRMASYLGVTGNASAARQHRAAAAALQPNDPLLLSFLAEGAANEGRWEEAIVLQRRASAVDRLSPVSAANLAHFLFLAGRIEEAKQEFAKVIELDPTYPDEIIVFEQILQGRFDEALRKVETWRDGVARDKCLALIYHGLGRSTKSDEHLHSLIATAGSTDPVLVAEVYAFRGETEAAFQWLQSSRPRLRIPHMMYASPFLKSLQADARWAQVTERKH